MNTIDDFPITLLFPPQGHFTQPYLALPCLKAWLRSRGFLDVELVDANIESYDHFLTRSSLEKAAARVRERLPVERFRGRSELGFEDLPAYRAAIESAVSADALAARIDEAKRVLRSGAFYDVERYLPAVRTIYHALRLASAAWHPTSLTPHNFTMRYGIDRAQDVLAAIRDEDENPFLAYFREKLLPRIVMRRPRVLGLSIIYGSQLIPALTLARLVKQALPDCHITAGGGFLAYIGRKLMQAPGMEACLDSLVFFEGERPLEELCRALAADGPLHEVGSLAWFDRSGPAPRAVFNAAAYPIRLDDAPSPDFDGLPFELYFTPDIVIPYDVNRGCYYSECTFCTLPTVIGPGYRTRRVSTIVDHVVHLRDKYGTRHMNFVTDCMPPGMIRDLPLALLEKRADIRWWSDARVEPKAYTDEGCERLYASGCRKLLFGFETATPRLLEMMKKGQELEETLDVAKNCARAGISVTFYAMVGFPSETRDEAQATIDFLVRNKDVVREVSLQTFHIDEVAETYRDAAKFGLTILDEPGADLALYHSYRAESGMTEQEAAEVFESMMSALRSAFPLFSGDNILFFMQKSHYFLHLARGTTPDEFAARCVRRSAARDSQSAAGDLAFEDVVKTMAIPFGYRDALAKLADPRARAARPDFMTGRFVADAEELARRELGAVAARERVLCYNADSAEFADIAPDGVVALTALRRAGTLANLLSKLAPDNDRARANLTTFARELERAGIALRRTEPKSTSPRGKSGTRPHASKPKERPS